MVEDGVHASRQVPVRGATLGAMNESFTDIDVLRRVVDDIERPAQAAPETAGAARPPA